MAIISKGYQHMMAGAMADRLLEVTPEAAIENLPDCTDSEHLWERVDNYPVEEQFLDALISYRDTGARCTYCGLLVGAGLV